MKSELLYFGPYLTKRLALDKASQQKYRNDPKEDTKWGYDGERYGRPFFGNEGKDAEIHGLLAPVEQVMVDRIRDLLTQQQTVTVMDYGAGAAQSLKHVAGIFKGDKRVIFFATSLSQTPPAPFLHGLNPKNPEIHYIPGDITDILHHQTQTLADGREISLTHGIDIFFSDYAISHSRVPGIVFSQLPLILHDNSVAIIGNHWYSPLSDREILGEDLSKAVERARGREWDAGIAHIQQQGFKLITGPSRDEYNYLVFAGQQVGKIALPRREA